MTARTLLGILALVVLGLLLWELRWVMLALFGAVVLAVATPKDATEPVLYLPGAVIKTHAHRYEHNGVIVPNDQVDGVWTRPDYAPKTQEVDPADRFIRWRAPKVANIASVKVNGEVTEGECIDSFRQAVERFRVAEGLTQEQMNKLFTISKETVEQTASQTV